VWRRQSWVLVSGLLFFGACSDHRSASVPRADSASAFAMVAAAPPAPSTRAQFASHKEADASTAGGRANEGIPGATVKLIRSAELNIQVLSVDQALRIIDTATRSRRALVADARVTQDDNKRHNARLIIRVPSDRFDETLAALRPLGNVKSENVTSDDVTKNYSDLETRLAVSEATVERMKALLANRTAKLTDVLQVERELAREIAEIERMKGERRYYDQQIAMSSIAVTLFEPPLIVRQHFAAPIGAAFSRSVDVLATSLASVIYFVTFLAPWVGLVVLAWWGLGRFGVRWPFRRDVRILETVTPGG